MSDNMVLSMPVSPTPCMLHTSCTSLTAPGPLSTSGHTEPTLMITKGCDGVTQQIGQGDNKQSSRDCDTRWTLQNRPPKPAHEGYVWVLITFLGTLEAIATVFGPIGALLERWGQRVGF